MSKRRRMTGKERREQRRRARQGLRWLRGETALVVAGTVTVALVGLALVLAVFGGGGDGAGDGAEEPATPPAVTVVVGESGPPPVDAEPTFSDTGLGIIDLAPGAGETPVAGQTVVVNYTGWLSDGTKFASSLDTGTPLEVVLGAGGVIAGWEEGLATMKAGGQRRLIIPADLAYGEQGRPPTIPPNAELTFDIELVEIR